jgi:hypothetical protein
MVKVRMVFPGSQRKYTRWLAAVVVAVMISGMPVNVMVAGQTSVTVAVTGDISKPDARVVSDFIYAQKPLDAVLLVGDTCNTSPTPIGQYQKVYKDTYDRFMPIIFPCPGNHDKLSKPFFSAYSTFWGSAAHAPEMYYSFDLGGWHVVSLDSVTFHEGKAAAQKQLEWLKSDLEANPKKPMLFYWHYPLFSRAKHCGDPKMKPLWTLIYANGPALVFNGHNHVYERFPPLDPDGNIVDADRGIQEFVIGPGGSSSEKKESSIAVPPASAFFHAGTQHVGFFVLQPDGSYQYSVTSIDKKGMTNIVDRGSGKLLMK